MELYIVANDTNTVIDKIKKYFLRFGKNILANKINVEIRGGYNTKMKEISKIVEEVSKNYRKNSILTFSTILEEGKFNYKEVTITSDM